MTTRAPAGQELSGPVPGPEPRDELGQASVELALVLPLLGLLLLAVIQVGLVVRAQLLVAQAAREAARAAAVDPDAEAAQKAAEAAAPLDAQRLLVKVGPRSSPGSLVRVDVSYTARTDVPLVGRLIGDVELHANATMRVEAAATVRAGQTGERSPGGEH